MKKKNWPILAVGTVMALAGITMRPNGTTAHILVGIGLLVIVLVTFWNVIKITRNVGVMPTEAPLELLHHNDPDFFPELNETFLKSWASAVKTNYEDIEKIFLYRALFAYSAPTSFSPKAKYIFYYRFNRSTQRGRFQEDTFSKLLRQSSEFLNQGDLINAYRVREDIHENWLDDWDGVTEKPYDVDKVSYWILV